jgi:hypothetical protein
MDQPPSAGGGRAGLKRVLGLTAGLGVVVGLAFVVGRPHGDGEVVAVNYLATKGPRPDGLKIFLQRGQELAILDPATELRGGDRLRLVVRASAPRYLVVRARDGAGRERLLFPAPGAATAGLVHPDQALPDTLAIDDTPGKAIVTALFGKQPFSIDARADDQIVAVTIDLMKAR